MEGGFKPRNVVKLLHNFKSNYPNFSTVILLRIKFSDLNLGILHKLDAGQNRVPEGGRAEAGQNMVPEGGRAEAGQNMVPEGGRAEAVHGKSRVYTP
jgi:hypothetical protein